MGRTANNFGRQISLRYMPGKVCHFCGTHHNVPERHMPVCNKAPAELRATIKNLTALWEAYKLQDKNGPAFKGLQSCGPPALAKWPGPAAAANAGGPEQQLVPEQQQTADSTAPPAGVQPQQQVQQLLAAAAPAGAVASEGIAAAPADSTVTDIQQAVQTVVARSTPSAPRQSIMPDRLTEEALLAMTTPQAQSKVCVSSVEDVVRIVDTALEGAEIKLMRLKEGVVSVCWPCQGISDAQLCRKQWCIGCRVVLRPGIAAQHSRATTELALPKCRVCNSAMQMPVWEREQRVGTSSGHIAFT